MDDIADADPLLEEEEFQYPISKKQFKIAIVIFNSIIALALVLLFSFSLIGLQDFFTGLVVDLIAFIALFLALNSLGKKSRL